MEEYTQNEPEEIFSLSEMKTLKKWNLTQGYIRELGSRINGVMANADFERLIAKSGRDQ